MKDINAAPQKVEPKRDTNIVDAEIISKPSVKPDQDVQKPAEDISKPSQDIPRLTYEIKQVEPDLPKAIGEVLKDLQNRIPRLIEHL